MNYKRLFSMSSGHMAIDILMSSLTVVLTDLSGIFELSIGQIGLAVMIYTWVGSLTQPFFGILADRWRGRWLGAAGLFWMLFFYALIPFASSYVLLVTLLAVGSLGSAAIHAVGMLVASDAGGDQPTTATSTFFLFGQTGLALGPVLAGIILGRLGVSALPLLSLLALLVALIMYAYLRDPIAEIVDAPIAVKTQNGTAQAISWGILGTFALLIVLRAVTQHSYMVYLPKFLENQGYTTEQYGWMVGAFIFGGALGTFFGGLLGDRFNRRMIIFVSNVICIPFCYLMLGASGPSFYVLAALAGGLLAMPHSIIIIMSQALLPKRKGMMGGVTLGFMFASGATVAWLAGVVADQVGLSQVMYFLAFVPIAAGLSALLLPSTRQEPTLTSLPAASAGD